MNGDREKEKRELIGEMLAKFLTSSKIVFFETLTRLQLVPEQQIELQQIDTSVEHVAEQVVTEMYAGVREQADLRILIETPD